MIASLSLAGDSHRRMARRVPSGDRGAGPRSTVTPRASSERSPPRKTSSSAQSSENSRVKSSSLDASRHTPSSSLGNIQGSVEGDVAVSAAGGRPGAQVVVGAGLSDSGAQLVAGAEVVAGAGRAGSGAGAIVGAGHPCAGLSGSVLIGSRLVGACSCAGGVAIRLRTDETTTATIYTTKKRGIRRSNALTYSFDSPGFLVGSSAGLSCATDCLISVSAITFFMAK